MKEKLIEKVDEIVKSLEASEQIIEVRGALASAKTFKNSLGILDEKYLVVEVKQETGLKTKEDHKIEEVNTKLKESKNK